MLIWLVRDTSNTDKKKTSEKQESDSEEEESRTKTKVVLETITNTEYETLMKNNEMVEEESEVDIDTSEIKCQNYFVYDFPQSLIKKKKVDFKFEM